jgi:hypothetical protein
MIEIDFSRQLAALRQPTPEDLEREATALHWLAQHPHAPADLRDLAEFALAALEWSLGKAPACDRPSGALKSALAQYLEATAGEQSCKVCGCTTDFACPQGCYWIEENLCSTCAHQSAEERSDLVAAAGEGEAP